MLPMTVLRRFDCVLAQTKAKVLAEQEKRKGGKLNDDALDKLLNRAAGQRFHNHSPPYARWPPAWRWIDRHGACGLMTAGSCLATLLTFVRTSVFTQKRA